MKSRRGFLLVCLIALGGGVLAWWLTSVNLRPQERIEAIAGTGGNNSTKPFSLKDIPIYPDARNRWDPYSNLPITTEQTRYESSASTEDIVEFYKNALGQPGWELRNVAKFDPSRPILFFYWSDPQDEAPYQLDMTVSIRGDDPRLVQLHLVRLSDPNKIPLYPGAMQQKVEYVPGQDQDAGGSELDTKVTSYVTNASPSEIKQFYVSFLGSYGWKLAEGSKDHTADNDYDNGNKGNSNDNDRTYSFWYTYGLSGGDGAGGAEAAITATPDVSGQTRVELRVRGRNIVDASHNEQK